LFSQDGSQISIHKELQYQIKFMRAILNAAYQNHSNERLDIFCPSLSNQELVEVVNFLCRGQFTSPDEIKACRILENLTEVFRFPKSLNTITPFMVQTKAETIDYSAGHDLTDDIDKSVVIVLTAIPKQMGGLPKA
jgi:hypothetical protein